MAKGAQMLAQWLALPSYFNVYYQAFFVQMGQNSSGGKLKNYLNSSEKFPKLKQNFPKTQIRGYLSRKKRTLSIFQSDITTNKHKQVIFCPKLKLI